MAKQLPDKTSNEIQVSRIFSKIKLIVADLDGTIIKHGSTKPPKTIKRIYYNQGFDKYNVNLTIATGRTLFGALPILRDFTIPEGFPLILYNGGMIIANGSFDILWHRAISYESLSRIVKVASAFNVRTLAYLSHQSAPREVKEYVMGWTTTSQYPLDFNGMPIMWQRLPLIKEDIFPITMLIDISEDQNSVEDIYLRLAEIDDIS